MRGKITSEAIERIRPPRGKRLAKPIMFRDHGDGAIRGFGARIGVGGEVSYFLEYSPAAGIRRRMTVGTYPTFTPAEARQRARDLKQKAEHGTDPLDEKRLAGAFTPPAMTFKEWAGDGGTYRGTITTNASFKGVVRALDAAIEVFGDKPLRDVSAQDVKTPFVAMTETAPIGANRWLAAVRASLTEAWRRGLIDENPVLRIKPNPENEPRRRVLSEKEVGALLKAIDAELPEVRVAFLLRLATGARESEVLRAEMADFDLDKRTWTIQKAKSGRRETVPIPDNIVKALRAVAKGATSAWLLPGRHGGHRYDLKDTWDRIHAVKGLGDIWAADLRRTVGLTMFRQHGLKATQQMLRHSSPVVTSRVYTPMSDEELRVAAADVSKQLTTRKRATRKKQTRHRDA